MATSQEQGGFVASLPSPTPSTSSISSARPSLPRPRSHPLRAGSAKEDAVRRYLENRLLHVSRRYTKKFQPAEDSRTGDVEGYVSMSEVAKDLGEIVDVVWLSGTPSLQTQYLMCVAGMVNSYLPALPPVPRATFLLLRKLDHVFSSMLDGKDIFTDLILPGFSTGTGVGFSRTDMVRIKSIVKDTRMLSVGFMDSNDLENSQDIEATNTEIESSADEITAHEMDVARVYEQTITRLGNLLLEPKGSFNEAPILTSNSCDQDSTSVGVL